ncbi:MAG: lipopolysaccharide assembly protein LapB, partial [Granulosicoccaceae bacterium]
MLELLFLLLPVAAITGWYFGRRERSAPRASTTNLASDYFRGLNYLLNEEPDKAIEVFIQMVEVDNETVETHLALGNLFRRRGEVDRAIRIHQNIIARPVLSHQQRSLALYELGQDYMSAGLLDRAENLFGELVETGDYRVQALSRLLEIYEQEKDWQKAVSAATHLQQITGKPANKVVAQYYCELAEEAVLNADDKAAIRLLKKAHNVEKDCLRATLIEADIAMTARQWARAIKQLQVITADDFQIPEVLDKLELCYRSLGRLDEFLAYLEKLQANPDNIEAMLRYSAILHEQSGQRTAIDYIISQMKQRPSVRGLERLIKYHLENTEGQARNNMQILYDLINALMVKRFGYKCNA